VLSVTRSLCPTAIVTVRPFDSPARSSGGVSGVLALVAVVDLTPAVVVDGRVASTCADVPELPQATTKSPVAIAARTGVIFRI